MTARRAPERILVRCPNWLGDVVMTTPGLRALRRSRPDAWIVAQLPEPLMPLLEGSGLCDEVWPVAPRRAPFPSLVEEARRVAAARFDLGIAVPESISCALRMRLGRVRRIVGFARDPLRRLLLDQVVPAPSVWGRRRLISRERFVLQLMEAVGASRDSPGLELGVTAEESARLEAVLVTQGLSLAALTEDPPIVVAPGAGYGPAKCWPAASYAELGDRFAERGERVVLVGSAADRKQLAEVESAMKSRPIVLAGALEIGGLKALVSLARLLVSNDAGTRHVAAAFSVPSVIFFGPTSVAKTGDNLDAIEILESEHDCRPCYRRVCPIDHRCMTSIGVDRADAAASRALEAFRCGAPG
jgi:heptosyltransferase-2